MEPNGGGEVGLGIAPVIDLGQKAGDRHVPQSAMRFSSCQKGSSSVKLVR